LSKECFECDEKKENHKYQKKTKESSQHSKHSCDKRVAQFSIFLDQGASNNQTRSMMSVLSNAEQRRSNAVGWRTQKKTEKKRTL
jgi:hypothetical protein